MKLKNYGSLMIGGMLGLASSNAFALGIGLNQVTQELVGPYYIQYNNAEQFSATNSIDGNGSAAGTPAEGNWGIVQVSSIVSGTALNPPGSDIQGGGAPIFFDQASGGQITGIFYGIQLADPNNPVTATGGFMELWWQDCVDPACSNAVNIGSELADSTAPLKRTDTNMYTGFTQGTLLAKLEFADGVLGDGTGITVSTGVAPGSADGTAKSYQNVVLGAGGLWETKLDTDWFTLDPLGNPMTSRDARTDSNFSINGASAWNVAGTDIIGLRSNDPVRGYAVPEPSTVALLGLGLIGAGFSSRRRRV